ncbi:MAG: DNA polymerase III subunit delta [Firmicutes bacterium]|nr:DNA polymerase III subunit delta [Bacillota bacterium]
MLYLLYGTEKFLIDKEIKKIIKNEQIDSLNVNHFDLNLDTLENIIDDAQTISLFNDKKVIIINNSNIFTAKKNNIEQNTQVFEQYLENINPDTILIFVLYEEKLDERKKIVKVFKQKGQVQLFSNNTNIHNLVKEMFSGYQINFNTINLLIDRVGKNLAILEQEANKIITYKGDDINITDEDVVSLTHKSFDIDIFALIDAIIKKDKLQALNIYHEMLKLNEEPIKIIVMLSNQFRIIYQTKEMYKKGYTENDIASTLAIHPYRIKLALNSSRNYSNQNLLEYIKKLADLDIGIKTGNINKEIGLELFIINL